MASTFDVVVFGATGFTGRLACRYLARAYGGKGVRWAVAGRSRERLEALTATLAAQPDGVLVADASDYQSVAAVARRAKTVLSFAGPYAKLGAHLVDACAAEGADYCDITGEPHFIKGSVERHGGQTKACLVHCVGYDSIPFDLVTFAAAEALRDAGAGPCVEAELMVGPSAGGVSGGTLASAFGAMDDPEARSTDLRDLAPPHDASLPRAALQLGPRFSDAAACWTAPSVMAAINSRVVYRSAALLPSLYAPGATYTECTQIGTGAKGCLGAWATCAAMACGALLVFLRPTRWALQKTVLPAQGEGPSDEAQKTGFFNTYAFAKGAGGRSFVAHFGVNREALGGEQGGDPGYGATSVMAVEAALCLALQRDECPGAGGGVHTPASGLGDVLIKRLRDAGFTLDVSEASPGARLPKALRSTPL